MAITIGYTANAFLFIDIYKFATKRIINKMLSRKIKVAVVTNRIAITVIIIIIIISYIVFLGSVTDL